MQELALRLATTGAAAAIALLLHAAERAVAAAAVAWAAPTSTLGATSDSRARGCSADLAALHLPRRHQVCTSPTREMQLGGRPGGSPYSECPGVVLS